MEPYMYQNPSFRQDPISFMEMQAQYLRSLAQYYAHYIPPTPFMPASYQDPPKFDLSLQGQSEFLPYSSVRASQQPELPPFQQPKEVIQEKPEQIIFQIPEVEEIPDNFVVEKRTQPDDIPVRGAGMTFDQLIEEEMKKIGDIQEPVREKPKKDFLKRKSQSVSIIPSQQTKIKSKQQNVPRVKRNSTADQVVVSGQSRTFQQILDQQLQLQGQNPVKVQQNKPKREFLKRTSRTIPVNPPTENFNKKKPRKKWGKIEQSPITEETPKEKPKQNFLKRGEGTLCVQKKTVIEKQTPKQQPVRVKPSVKIPARPVNLSSSDSQIQFQAPMTTDSPCRNIAQQNYRTKQAYLDSQIAKYRHQNDKILNQKKKIEQQIRKIKKEFQVLYKHKQKDLREIEDMKEKQSKKLKKDNQQFQRNTKAQLSRKDQPELEKLKKVVHQLQIEIKTADAKHKAHLQSLRNKASRLDQIQKTPEFQSRKLNSSVNSNQSLENQNTPASQKLKKPPIKMLSSQSIQQTKTQYKVPQKPSPIRPQTRNRQKQAVQLSSEEEASNILNQIIGEDGKVQRFYADGKKEILFTNGVRKQLFPDGAVIVNFKNNDIKKTLPDGKIVYFFAQTNTTQTTFTDGLQLFKFANGQIEKHHPDNTKEISFPDGTVKCIFPDGEQESIFPDGTVQKIDASGTKYIDFVNGQKDTIFPDGTKVREFPDGKIRKIMPDGKVVEY